MHPYQTVYKGVDNTMKTVVEYNCAIGIIFELCKRLYIYAEYDLIEESQEKYGIKKEECAV